MKRMITKTIAVTISVLLAVAGLPIFGETTNPPPQDFRNALHAIRHQLDCSQLNPAGILAAALFILSLDRRFPGWMVFLASDARPPGLLIGGGARANTDVRVTRVNPNRAHPVAQAP